MKTTYILQLAADHNRFEEVDEFVFNNRQHAQASDGSPRYTDNYMKVEGGQVQIQFTGLNDLLAGMARMAGSTRNNAGIVDTPTHVQIHKGRWTHLCEIGTGRRWKLAA